MDNFNIKNHEIAITRNMYGKPFYLNNRDISFNISHSGEWVVCAVDSNQLGIDIEEMKRVDYKLIHDIATKDEFKHYQSTSNKLNTFYKIWTLKESYVKALGIGLSIPFDTININFNSYPNTFNGFYFYNICLNNYMLSICSVKPLTLKKINIEYINRKTIINHFKDEV